MDIKKLKIAFIGGGNMAQAIITGLINTDFPPQNIMVCAPSNHTRLSVAKVHNVYVAENNAEAVSFAEVIFIAVKPNLVETIAKELQDAMAQFGSDKLIISVAAGVNTCQLAEYFTTTNRIISCMPNLPCSVGQGVTGLIPAKNSDSQDLKLAQQIFSSIGQTVLLNHDNQMPALVAAAGSAPAYFFLFLEAMIDSGKGLGLSQEQAKTSAIQSGLGALTMAMQSDLSVNELRNKVTSPNGTTQQALTSFENNNLKQIVNAAMQAAAQKAANY